MSKYEDQYLFSIPIVQVERLHHGETSSKYICFLFLLTDIDTFSSSSVQMRMIYRTGRTKSSETKRAGKDILDKVRLRLDMIS